MSSLILSQIDFVAILPFAVFGAIAIGAWAISESLFNRTSKSEERLMLIKQRPGDDKAGSPSKDGSRKTDGITRLLAKASPALGDVCSCARTQVVFSTLRLGTLPSTHLGIDGH